MRELAILIPTRGRPDNVRKVIAAWDFTDAWDHADMILIADADDPEIQKYRALVEATDLEELHLIVIPEWRPMVHKLNAAAREMASQYFALGFAGDDHLPRTIGWAKRYLTVLRELGTGMVYGDDGYQGKTLSTEWAVTSDAVLALGRMVPADVEHMYCDNSILDLYREAGAVRHLPEVRIEHMHPYAGGKSEMDDQYKRVNSREQFNRDRLEYTRWQRQQKAADVNAIIALHPRQTYTPTPNRRRQTSAPTQRKARYGMGLGPREFRNVRGATPDEIGIALADFARVVPADQAIVEIGVFQGRTALLMAWGARQGNGAHVWGIDPWDLEGNVYDPPFTDVGSKNWAEYNVRATGYGNAVTLIQDFSLKVAEDWGPDEKVPPIGLLFIDGDHTHKGARADVLAWAPHLAPGAVIAVDDYHHPDWPGVAEALDKLVDEGVIEPLEIFHDRLAVTRLTEDWAKPVKTPEDSEAVFADDREEPTAITSEGVEPTPHPITASGVILAGKAETVTLPAEPVTFSDAEPPVAAIDNSRVREGELGGNRTGVDITTLNLGQLRALARDRGIVLNTRKNKRSQTVQAILDGK